MKVYICILLSVFALNISTAQTTMIPDAAFEQELIDQGIDSDGIVNAQVLTSDIENLEDLEIFSNNSITDLTGLEDFSNLSRLELFELDLLEAIDITANSNLESLILSFSQVTSLNLTQNAQLKTLDVTHNRLTNLDLTENILLEEVYLGNPSFDTGPFNEFTTFDFSNNHLLKRVSCIALGLEIINLNPLANLEIFNGYINNFDELDVSNNPNLRVLDVGFYNSSAFTSPSNFITNLDLTANANLEIVRVENMRLESLNVKNGNNEILSNLRASRNVNLACILVDDENAAMNGDIPYGEWVLDDEVTFSDDTCSLSINDADVISVTVLPNPVQKTVYLNTANLVVKELLVYNLLGNKVYWSKNNLETIDVSTWKSGVYFFEIQFNKGAILKKIVKR